MRERIWTLTLALGCGVVTSAGCEIDDGDDFPVIDAGSGDERDADPGDGIESRCDTEVSTSTVCLEAVGGRPGDTVEVAVHVLLDEGICSEFHEAFAIVEYDHEVFALASDEVDGDCYKLDDYEFSDGARVVDWYIKADVDGSTDCPEPFSPGPQGTIEFTIRAGAPEGEYTLLLETASVGGAEEVCDGFRGIGGVIHVLP
jgi:hypothetical protein